MFLKSTGYSCSDPPLPHLSLPARVMVELVIYISLLKRSSKLKSIGIIDNSPIFRSWKLRVRDGLGDLRQDQLCPHGGKAPDPDSLGNPLRRRPEVGGTCT